jgi:lipopolysaccharide export system permease protein
MLQKYFILLCNSNKKSELKKIDVYIIKKFISTFFFSIILFLIIAVVIDLVERIDDFLECNASFYIIITQYYLPFIPWIGAQLFPLFVFLSVLLFTSKMAGESEIISMLGNSVSYYRIMRPYVVTAIFLSIMLYGANHYLVPWSNAKKLAFENTYFHGGRKESAQNLHLRLSKNEFIFLENYNHAENEGYKFGYEKFEDNKLVYKLTADKLEWNYQKRNWNLVNVTIRTFKGMNETFEKKETENRQFKISPTDFEKKQEVKEAMSSPVLSAYIRQEEQRGADNLEPFYVERYGRTAAAYSLLIMTLIAFAVASRKARGGIGVHMAFGLLLSALYILFMRMSTTFANQAGLNPYLGVWLPNILFTGIAIYLIKKAQK